MTSFEPISDIYLLFFPFNQSLSFKPFEKERRQSTKLEIIGNSTVVWETVIPDFGKIFTNPSGRQVAAGAYFLQGPGLALGLRVNGK